MNRKATLIAINKHLYTLDEYEMKSLLKSKKRELLDGVTDKATRKLLRKAFKLGATAASESILYSVQEYDKETSW